MDSFKEVFKANFSNTAHIANMAVLVLIGLAIGYFLMGRSAA